MKLYYAPGACSLSDHIALHEANIAFDHEKVDLNAKVTESGADYTQINPKGYVPALALDTGEVVSENVAILEWISQQDTLLVPPGPLGRTHLLEVLAYISSEVHKAFKPFFSGAGAEEKAEARKTILKRLSYLSDTMQGNFLFGDAISAADCYLFVMLLWATKNEIALPAKLTGLRDRMQDRPAVQKAMQHEGLL
ncbi:glutathione binding-like protein [Sphingomonas immobilis]|uniref:Glutathione S-transferase C-terminal domain-containing protein n=1 Tax=Sphingomonas immobilis TaxID=3063997 RepID=A0ABT8ZXI6_9SPHN|nr:glutathione binding-like protein [Sphingomonas sp. CA1-15]MDO7841730.1 glutathione S-transferase C-terminal domain-containing protein [Sphingomonas sp. CA1-15]